MLRTSMKLECETIEYSFALNDLLPLVKVRHLLSLQIFIRGPKGKERLDVIANGIDLNLNHSFTIMMTKCNYEQYCRLRCSKF